MHLLLDEGTYPAIATHDEASLGRLGGRHITLAAGALVPAEAHP